MILKKEHQPFIIVGLAALVVASLFINATPKEASDEPQHHAIPQAVAARFAHLSEHGNASCSAEFNQAVAAGTTGERIQGSCCSPMDLHRYAEQIEALRKYSHISEIPPDPYDIDPMLAKEYAAHYGDQLTPDQQAAYDYAMENSHEKGPCCCKCWHWYVYGGLAKVLMQKYNFSGEQIAEVWDLSDGCGGSGDHMG